MRYVLAVVATAAVVLIRLALSGLLGDEAPLLLFILAILLAGWYGGLKPGLLATGLSLLAGTYFFIERTGLHIHQASDQVRMVVLVVVGGLTSWLCESVHRHRRRLLAQQQVLQASNDRLLAFIRTAPVAIAMFDREMRYAAVSRRWLTDYGLEGRDLIGQSHYVVFPEMPERWKIAHQRGLAGESLRAEEYRFDRADGSCQWVRWELQPWYTEKGEVGGVVIASEDITERKRVEDQLHDSQQQLQQLFNGSPLPAVLYALSDGRIVDVNDRFLEVFEDSRDNVIGRTGPEIGLWCELTERDQLVTRVRQEGMVRNFESRLRTRSGRELDMVLAAQVIEWSTGAVVLVQANDVTERKRAEQALRASEATLRAYFEHTAVGMAQVNSESRFARVNDRFCAITGYSREELLGGMGPLDLDHPEDRAADTEMIAQFFGGALPTYECEKRYVRMDGQVVWVHVTATCIRDDAGRFTCTAGVIEDITERKRAEEALRESEQKFRQLAETVDQVFWVGSPDKQQLYYVSPAYEKIWGRSCASLFADPMSWWQAIHPDDRERIRAVLPSQVEGDYDREYRIVRPDGSVRWIRDRAFPVKNDRGEVYRLVGIADDVTERKRDEAALRESEATLRAFYDNAPVMMGIVELGDDDILHVSDNPATARFFQTSPEAMRNQWGTQLGAPLSVIRTWIQHYRESERMNRSVHFEYEHPLPGGVRCFSVNVSHIAMPPGRQPRYCYVLEDVTERKRTEEALRQSEERLRLTLDNAQHGLWDWEIETGREYLDDRWYAIHGYPPGERPPTYQLWEQSIHPEDKPRVMAVLQRHLECSDALYDVDYRARTRSGAWIWINTRGRVHQRDADGKPLRMMGTIRDITERKQAEQRLQASQHMLEMVLNNIPQGVFWKDPQARYQGCNPVVCRAAGLERPEQIVGKTDRELPGLMRELADSFTRSDQEVLASGQPIHGMIQQVMMPDGSLVWLETDKIPMRDAQGHVVGILGTWQDITERKQKEEELLTLSTALEAAANGICITDQGGVIQWVNSAFTMITGYSKEEVVGQTPRMLKSGEHEPPFYQRLWDTILAGKVWRGRMSNRRKDGSLYHEEQTIAPVVDEQGRICSFIAIKEDATEKELLERQLRQSQKMDAVGQLAGGVAHDFNNLLTVINGYASMLLAQMAPENPMRQPLEQIIHAGERAASLTSQLLALGRKQVLQPKVVDLNAVVADAEKLLRRLIGEDVELLAQYGPGLAPVKADPNQLGQVLLNLAVNARDAMPRGGKLIIETSNADLDDADASRRPDVMPGRYVLLTVSDTGCGMNSDVQSHIFEPFFTTKAMGKGTGLGLAVVHGIVKQSGGHIEVLSEPGQGTTFKIYLPARSDEPALRPGGRLPESARAGVETVLLVEDEAAVRLLAQTMLETRGYTVLAAANGQEALRLAETQVGGIDLLLTDVVMPDLSGPQLAEILRGRFTRLRVLFMSGYMPDTVLRHGIREGDVAFLQKPFGTAALVNKVREVLDS